LDKRVLTGRLDIELNWILLFLSIIIILERFFGSRIYALFSAHFREDLFWFGLNYWLYPFLFVLISYNESEFLSSFISEHFSFLDLTKTSFHIQFGILLLSSDFLSYCFHRFFHSVSPLWNMHRLHHSSTELTAISSFRYSWSDFFLHTTLMAVCTSLVKVLPSVRFYMGIGFMSICIIQHMNIRLKYPRFIEYLIITPKNHYWHHSKELHFSKGQNFGFIFPWWDRLFNTYYNPEHLNTEIGFSDNFSYVSSFQKFIYPFDKWFVKLFYWWKK
jgi:sterol desaturase/sphingolipid hydroxylase (fatty acid hydroxylase superfamily)